MVGHVSQCEETQNEMHDNKYYTAAGNATLGQCGLVVGMYAKVGPDSLPASLSLPLPLRHFHFTQSFTHTKLTSRCGEERDGEGLDEQPATERRGDGGLGTGEAGASVAVKAAYRSISRETERERERERGSHCSFP